MNKNWKYSEEQFLYSQMGKMPIKEIALTLGRSLNSVSLKAQNLNLKTGKKTEWVKEELSKMKTAKSLTEAFEMFNYRSVESVKKKYYQLIRSQQAEEDIAWDRTGNLPLSYKH